jgi:glyoxylase-like metal-dependent hydrolase (beta-lactamase superfamily II)
MHEQAKSKQDKFVTVFPGQIADNTAVLAEPVPTEGFELEGNLLHPVATGHTDTDHTTALHVPSLGLVVAGDAAYNGVHQMIAEGADGGLQQWLSGIDIIADLNPRHIVAGHKNKNLPDDPIILAQTRQYLHDAIALLDTKPSPLEFFDQMMERHSTRLNPGPLWASALALLGEDSGVY